MTVCAATSRALSSWAIATAVVGDVSGCCAVSGATLSGREWSLQPMSCQFMPSKATRAHHLSRYVLSCISIDSDAVTVPLRFGGDFSGEENMPERGSKPCSSYTPLSVSVMPVFLRSLVKHAQLRVRPMLCLPSLHANIVELVLAILAFSLGRHGFKLQERVE
jgi:hypothetical protein